MIDTTDRETQEYILKKDIEDLGEKLLFHLTKTDKGNKKVHFQEMRDLKNLLKEKLECYGLIEDAKCVSNGQ